VGFKLVQVQRYRLYQFQFQFLIIFRIIILAKNSNPQNSTSFRQTSAVTLSLYSSFSQSSITKQQSLVITFYMTCCEIKSFCGGRNFILCLLRLWHEFKLRKDMNQCSSAKTPPILSILSGFFCV